MDMRCLPVSQRKEGRGVLLRFQGVHMTKIPLQAQSLHEVCTLFPLLTLDGLSIPLWTKHPFSLESFDKKCHQVTIQSSQQPLFTWQLSDNIQFL